MKHSAAAALIAGAALALAASTAAGSVRPDNRAGPLGASPNTVQTLRPDDRAGIRGPSQPTMADQTDALSRYIANHTTGVRADDRAGWRGTAPDLVTPLATTTASGTSWHDLGLGALIGAAATLALAIAYTNRRHIHIHRPHHPLHSH